MTRRDPAVPRTRSCPTCGGSGAGSGYGPGGAGGACTDCRTTGEVTYEKAARLEAAAAAHRKDGSVTDEPQSIEGEEGAAVIVALLVAVAQSKAQQSRYGRR